LSSDVSENLQLVDQLLESQLRAIRWQLALAVGCIVIGLALLGIGTLFSQQIEGSFLKSGLLSGSGMFASTLSAFPIKDLIVRREKADALRLIRSRLTSSDPAEIEQMKAMLMSSLKTLIER